MLAQLAAFLRPSAGNGSLPAVRITFFRTTVNTASLLGQPAEAHSCDAASSCSTGMLHEQRSRQNRHLWRRFEQSCQGTAKAFRQCRECMVLSQFVLHSEVHVRAAATQAHIGECTIYTASNAEQQQFGDRGDCDLIS